MKKGEILKEIKVTEKQMDVVNETFAEIAASYMEIRDLLTRKMRLLRRELAEKSAKSKEGK